MSTAIVVAGGKSTRFGSDKLRTRIAGSTLLERSIRAARSRCGVVAVVTAEQLPICDGIVWVSEYPRWSGPAAAIAAGVSAIGQAQDVLIIAADLAHPRAAIDALSSAPYGVLVHPDGHPRWLLAKAEFGTLQASVGIGDLRGRPARELTGTAPGRPRVTADVCADIDRPGDLIHLTEETHDGTF